MKYRLVVLPVVERTLALLSPVAKRRIRFGLDVIQDDPYRGKPLRDELLGLRSFRVHHYRIIYRIHHSRIEVQVIDIALRAVVYGRVAQWLRDQQGGQAG